MGDRVIFHIHDGKEIGPAIYGHWSGSYWREYVEDLADLMKTRGADVSYASARLVGLIHERVPGNLSLGIWNGPERNYETARELITDCEYSHGDAGVILIDCRDWSVEAFNGYAADGKPDPLPEASVEDQARDLLAQWLKGAQDGTINPKGGGALSTRTAKLLDRMRASHD